MKSLLTFEEFVNEHYAVEEATDTDGFDPTKTVDVDATAGVLKAISELLPGKEYILTVDGTKQTDMLYQGVTDGIYIFNGEDKANDLQFTEEEMNALVTAGSVTLVAE